MQKIQGDNTVLQFIQDMPFKNAGFFSNILGLFEKYLEISTSLVLTYPSRGAVARGMTRKYKYIVRNLNPNQITLYFSEYYKSDAYVTKRRKVKKVTALTELSTEEELQELPYYKYLNSLGIYYQACIFLRDGKRLLATISLFRPKEKGDFAPEELDLLRTLEPFITRQYQQVLEVHQEMSIENRFDEYFSDLSIGVALLDRNQRILKANAAFCAFSAYILENGTIEETIVTRETVDVPPEYGSGQKLLNYFGADIVTKPKRIHIECMLYLYRIHTKSVYAQDLSGFNAFEQMYLVFLIRQEKIRSQEMLDAIEILTPREMTVLGYLTSGMSNAEIADAMAVSPLTVKTHIQNIYSKCNVSTRNELFAKLR